jgi:hypothetical protein
MRCHEPPFAPAVVMASTICRSPRARAGAARSSSMSGSYFSNRTARSSNRAVRSGHCEILRLWGHQTQTSSSRWCPLPVANLVEPQAN